MKAAATISGNGLYIRCYHKGTKMYLQDDAKGLTLSSQRTFPFR